MNSFTFGLWTGIVTGVVFAALMKQSSHKPSMEEKLLGPHAAHTASPPPTSAPSNLADMLAERDRSQA